MTYTLDSLPTCKQKLGVFFTELRQTLNIPNWSSLKDNPEAIEQLNQLGFGVNKQNKNGATLLHFSALHGDMELLKGLIAIGFDVRALDTSERTIIYYAAWGGCDMHFLEFIVSQGLDLQATDNGGGTVLHYAASSGSIPLIVALINRGFDIKILDAQGRGLTHWALFSGHDHLLSFLKNKEVNILLKDIYGRSAIHEALAGGHIHLLDTLQAHGFDIHEKTKSDRNIAHIAALFGHTHLIDRLKEKGVNIHAIDNGGASLIHYVAQSGESNSIEALELLKAKGWNIYALDKAGKSALHYAALGGDDKLIITLIKDYGFKPILDKNGKGLLYHAEQSENQKTIDLCSDTFYLDQLYQEYLSSQVTFFIPKDFPSPVASLISEYALPEKTQQEALEYQLDQIKIRIRIALQPFISFCDQNEKNAEARALLNSLLEKKSVEDLEKELNRLLMNQEIKKKTYLSSLMLCRLLTTTITNNSPHFYIGEEFQEQNLKYQKLILEKELLEKQLKQKEEQCQQLSLELVGPSLDKNKESSYSFLFSCLIGLAAVSTATLVVGIIAITTLISVVSIATVACGGVALGLSLFGLYRCDERRNEEEGPVLAQSLPPG